MLKLLAPDAWIWDAEWVPDPTTGRLVYSLPADMPDVDVITEMWARAGATAEEPRPYLKTALCRIVSIAVLQRAERSGKVKLRLKSIPALEGMLLSERDIVDKFLAGVGATKPQLVGFSSKNADLPILLQRAIAHELHQPQFGERPKKPWEGVDYFVKYSDWNVDLKDELSGFGKSTPSLHELAVSCGIPGKFFGAGGDVVDLWLAGKHQQIVQYCQCDVLTTYEIFIRFALLAGLINPDQYTAEQDVLATLLADLITAPGSTVASGHIQAYVGERERLRAALHPKAPVPAVERQLAIV